MAYFTVIIPLYNKENHIENTLKSVLNQSFQDFEILIIEDCSTDNSKKVAESVTSDKIKIIQHEKNKGLSASRNTGIANANATYLAFLDADDLWHKNYLEKIKELTENFTEAHLFATNYTELDTGITGNNIEVIGVALRKRKKEDIVNSIQSSDFIIQSSKF